MFLSRLEGTSTLSSPTEGKDEWRLRLHTYMEKHEILVYPIHRQMRELKEHAEMKVKFTHFENGCTK
jgi:hypothetical protein